MEKTNLPDIEESPAQKEAEQSKGKGKEKSSNKGKEKQKQSNSINNKDLANMHNRVELGKSQNKKRKNGCC